MDSGELVNAHFGSDERLVEWSATIRRWIGGNASVPTSETDDLIQEVFLKLLCYSTAVAVANPKGYVFRVAMNVINDWRERRKPRMPHSDIWLKRLPVADNEEPENAFSRGQGNQRIRAAVDSLPSRQREMLLLHVVEGLTYHRIAESRGLPHRIVRRELTRAYETLRTRLMLDGPRQPERPRRKAE